MNTLKSFLKKIKNQTFKELSESSELEKFIKGIFQTFVHKISDSNRIFDIYNTKDAIELLQQNAKINKLCTELVKKSVTEKTISSVASKADVLATRIVQGTYDKTFYDLKWGSTSDFIRKNAEKHVSEIVQELKKILKEETKNE